MIQMRCWSHIKIYYNILYSY